MARNVSLQRGRTSSGQQLQIHLQSLKHDCVEGLVQPAHVGQLVDLFAGCVGTLILKEQVSFSVQKSITISQNLITYRVRKEALQLILAALRLSRQSQRQAELLAPFEAALTIFCGFVGYCPPLRLMRAFSLSHLVRFTSKFPRFKVRRCLQDLLLELLNALARFALELLLGR